MCVSGGAPTRSLGSPVRAEERLAVAAPERRAAARPGTAGRSRRAGAAKRSGEPAPFARVAQGPIARGAGGQVESAAMHGVLMLERVCSATMHSNVPAG